MNQSNHNPVRVEKDKIVYKYSDMEIGRLYEVIWQGEKWALKNNGREIEFLRWIEE